jgi:hypothetical protein
MDKYSTTRTSTRIKFSLQDDWKMSELRKKDDNKQPIFHLNHSSLAIIDAHGHFDYNQLYTHSHTPLEPDILTPGTHAHLHECRGAPQDTTGAT